MLSPARRTSKQNKRGRGLTGQIPGENGHSQARLVRRRIVSADHRARGEQARVEGSALRPERTKAGVDPDAHPKSLMLALDLLGEEIPDVLIRGPLSPSEERQVEHRFRKALGPYDPTPDELPGREDGGGRLDGSAPLQGENTGSGLGALHPGLEDGDPRPTERRIKYFLKPHPGNRRRAREHLGAGTAAEQLRKPGRERFA